MEFHCKADYLGKIPPPYPASGAVPQWLSQMPADYAGEPTAGRCAPFLQAITAGYIIPAPFDVHFQYSPQGELLWKCDEGLVGGHSANQYPRAPFASLKVIRFINPWMVKTPPGYSTLFTSPFGRFDSPFTPLTGLVETDNYSAPVHFPSLCRMPPGSAYTLARGAPLVQIIPVLREPWTSTLNAADPSLVQAATDAEAANPHHYKDVSWRKLEYE